MLCPLYFKLLFVTERRKLVKFIWLEGSGFVFGCADYLSKSTSYVGDLVSTLVHVKLITRIRIYR